MIVIGDVHGCYDLLMKLVEKLPKTEDLCFVGDLIDRGPDSKKVVDFVIDNEYKCVLGNHEEFLIHSIDESGCIDEDVFHIWSANGGHATRDSFGNILFDSYYLNFFRSLPLFVEFTSQDDETNYLVSHSYALDGRNTTRDDLLWGRSFNKKTTGDFVNIFGHTINTNPVQFHNMHWCIDTGAFSRGKLTALYCGVHPRFYFAEV